MLQYNPRVVQDGLISYIDTTNNKSYPSYTLPVKNGCICWLDAADATSINFQTGSYVSKWFDKSGFGNHVTQSSTAVQPLRNTTQNSKSTISFSGAYLTSENNVVFASSSYTKIAVVKQTSTATVGNFLGKSSGANDTFWYGGTTQVNLYHNTATILTSTIVSPLNSWAINIGTFSSSAATANLYVNGVAAGNVSSVAQVGTSNIQIGAYGNSNFFTGEIAEIIIYNRVLTPKEILLVNTYLGQKWNITSSNYTMGNLANINYSASLLSCSFTQSSATTPGYVFTNVTGITQSNCILTNEIDFADSASYSLEFWVKNRSTPQATYHSLTGRSATAPWLFVYHNDTTGTNWYPSFRQNSGSVYNNFNSITNYNLTGSWAQLVFTFNPTKKVSFYLNGELKQTLTTVTDTSITTNRFGGGYSSSPNFYNWQGNLSIYKVYNKTLTPEEVYNNYLALKGRFYL